MPFKAKDIEVSEGGMNKPQINTFFYSDKPPEDDEKKGKKRKHDAEGGGNKKPFTPRCVSSDDWFFVPLFDKRLVAESLWNEALKVGHREYPGMRVCDTP